MKSKDFEIRTPFLGVGDPLKYTEITGVMSPLRIPVYVT